MAATETAAAPAAETAAAPKSPGVMMPLLAVFILMPALAYGLTTYVLIPKLRGALPAAEEASEAKPGGKKAEAKAETKGAKPAEAAKKAAPAETAKKEGKEGEASFEFKDVIVNLSGAMGTRYLKTSFTASGSSAKLPELMAANQKKMLDVTITVLSARTLNDLDEPTAKNAIREELVARFNQVLGAELVEEIFFSEFVIQ